MPHNNTDVFNVILTLSNHSIPVSQSFSANNEMIHIGSYRYCHFLKRSYVVRDKLSLLSLNGFMFQLASEKDCKVLKPWVPELIKYFWICAKECEGSEETFMVYQ